MSIYGYTVKQEGGDVVLKVYRENEIIQTRTFQWIGLSILTMFRCNEGSSKALSQQFSIAHKEGKKAVKLLEDNEKLDSGVVYVGK